MLKKFCIPGGLEPLEENDCYKWGAKISREYTPVNGSKSVWNSHTLSGLLAAKPAHLIVFHDGQDPGGKRCGF
jgi:hypothetical protein